MRLVLFIMTVIIPTIVQGGLLQPNRCYFSNKMRLVLFIMIVILLTIVQGVSLEEIEEGRCLNLVREGGRIICILRGHGDYGSFNGGNCSLLCKDQNFSEKLPDGECSTVGLAQTRVLLQDSKKKQASILSKIKSEKNIERVQGSPEFW
uniref:Putative kDa salivary secreted wc protein n=1 Tax=Ixodes ricinus TaxID=34613 RepID=A0A6B0UWH1_IXORI